MEQLVKPLYRPRANARGLFCGEETSTTVGQTVESPSNPGRFKTRGGSLYCYKVHYDEIWENLGPQVTDSWYADGFGLVKFFSPNVSPDPYIVTAGVIIPVEEKTWGWVKALFK